MIYVRVEPEGQHPYQASDQQTCDSQISLSLCIINQPSLLPRAAVLQTHNSIASSSSSDHSAPVRYELTSCSIVSDTTGFFVFCGIVCSPFSNSFRWWVIVTGLSPQSTWKWNWQNKRDRIRDKESLWWAGMSSFEYSNLVVCSGVRV